MASSNAVERGPSETDVVDVEIVGRRVTVMLVQRVAVVGAGSAGKRHAMIASTLLPYAEVNLLGSRELAGTGREALSALQADLIVLANPATYHVPDALAALDMHAHLLIEKPLAARVDEATALQDALLERSEVVMVAYNLRFLHSLRYFKELIDAHYLGEVLSVRAEVGQALPSWRPDVDYRTTVSAQKSLGGGVLLELSHEFDYLQWVFGPIEWVSGLVERVSDMAIDVEDTALVLLSAQTEAAARSIPISLSMDFVRHDHTRRCSAICRDGTITWDGVSGRVTVHRPLEPGQLMRDYGNEGLDSYRREWLELIDAIENSKPSPIPVAQGLAVLELVEAVRESARTGTRQRVSAGG